MPAAVSWALMDEALVLIESTQTGVPVSLSINVPLILCVYIQRQQNFIH